MAEQDDGGRGAWRVIRSILQRVVLAIGTAMLVGGVASGLKFGEAASACAFGAAIIVLFVPAPRRRPTPAVT